MSLRKNFWLLFGIQCALLAGLALLTVVLFLNQQALSKSQQIHMRSYLLADELRQSSDDLTRLARVYVSTGNEEYERQYWSVLAIRNGTSPRPKDYSRIYWDLVTDAGQKPRADGETISLRALMMKEGFTAAELAKLDTAEKSSNTLVETERIAMNAVKGFFDDGTGNFAVQRAPDRELAIRLMNDAAYHQNKADIMRPIDEFYAIFTERTAGDVARYEWIAQNLLIALGALITVILGMFRYSLTILQRQLTERAQAQEALKKSQGAYRGYFEMGSLGMCVTSPEKGWLEVNERLCQMLGYSKAELTGLTWAELTHPDDLTDDYQLFEEVLAGKRERYELDKRFIRKNGSVVYTALSVSCQRNAEGTVEYFLASLQDITARKQADEALRKSETMLSEVINSVPQSIFWKDLHSIYLGCNEVFARIAGLSDPKSVVGKTDFDLPWARENAEVYQADDQIVMESGQPKRRYLESLQQSNGSRLWIETTKVPLRAADGGVNGVLGVFDDITKRRDSEKMLHLRGAALEAAANAIVITDRQGIIEWANPAFTTLSSWELTEALGKNPRELVKSGKHDAAFYQQMWDTILAGRVWQGEVINRRKDGELRTESMTITPVRDGQETISHFIAIKQDITVQKAIEARMIQTQRIESIGTLASGVAHDLNNILSPMLLVAGMLKDTLREEGDLELVAMVQAGAKRGSEIVKQLLTFSRGQKGERIPVQLRHLVKEVAMVVRETFPREIELHLNLGNDLWTITADPTQLHQVLLNLCVNARDAMLKGGHLTIGAANVTLQEGTPGLAPGAHPGPYLAIKVHDTGHGIPPAIRHRIFDPFFTTKPLGMGTGLGLSTVLGVVQSHGGFVTVASEPDKGTTFTVYFPATDEVALPSPLGTAATAESALPSPLGTAATAEVAKSAPSAHMILVVDDEPSIIRGSKILLELHGYRVITAVNGRDALIQYIQNQVQVRLVLSDLMMPVMNGINLVRALRALDPKLHIIMTSGLSDVLPTAALAELGVSNVLKKPYEPSLLIATVHHQLAPS
jgi:PAS domain S-box-containing protein